MPRCFKQIRGKRKKQKSRRRREKRRGNLGRKRKRSGRVSEIKKGEVVEGVTGEVAGVRLDMEAVKVRQVVYKLNQTCLILKIQFVHLRTCNQVTSRPSRHRQMPARFCDSDSDQNDGVLCVLCSETSPTDLTDSTVFWVDCSKCGCWVFTMFVHSERTLSPVNILVFLVQCLNIKKKFNPHAFINHSIHSYNIPFVHTIFEEDLFFLMEFSIVRRY